MGTKPTVRDTASGKGQGYPALMEALRWQPWRLHAKRLTEPITDLREARERPSNWTPKSLRGIVALHFYG